MNDWNTLPIKERAAFIKIGVANGLRDIGSIREQYNKFQDGGLKDGHILELPRDSYEIWKSSLPSNLRNTDESLYNLREAYESGANPIYNSYDGLYHLNTRDPKTGEILKQPAHPTYILGLLEDIKMGYYPYTKDGKTYTGTWRGNENYLNTINKFQGGGLIDSTKLAFSGLDADMPKRDMDVNYEWRYTLPKVTTGAHNKAYSGNLFEEGGPTDSWKPWYWFTPSYDSQPSLKDAIMQAYKDGRRGNNILYKGRAYKALLNEQEDKEYKPALPNEDDLTIDWEGITTTGNRPYNTNYINYLYTKLADSDLTDQQKAIALGTWIEESGGDPYAISPDGKFQGINQWGEDRYKLVMIDNPTEEDIYKELDNQLAAYLNSVNNTTDKKSWTHGGTGSGYKRGVDAYNIYSNPESKLADAFRAHSWGYTRPTGKEESYKNRLKVVEQVYNRIHKDKNLYAGDNPNGQKMNRKPGPYADTYVMPTPIQQGYYERVNPPIDDPRLVINEQPTTKQLIENALTNIDYQAANLDELDRVANDWEDRVSAIQAGINTTQMTLLGSGVGAPLIIPLEVANRALGIVGGVNDAYQFGRGLYKTGKGLYQRLTEDNNAPSGYDVLGNGISTIQNGAELVSNWIPFIGNRIKSAIHKLPSNDAILSKIQAYLRNKGLSDMEIQNILSKYQNSAEDIADNLNDLLNHNTVGVGIESLLNQLAGEKTSYTKEGNSVEPK